MDRMENRELLLIGTVHGDPEGAARLIRLLQRENPSVILVEVSPYGLAYRKRNGRRLRRLLVKRLRRLSAAGGLRWKAWGQVHALFSQLRTPFEYGASLRFCRDSGTELWCVDLSSQSRLLIGEQWHELLSSENLKALLAEPPEDLSASVAGTYAHASRILSEREKAGLTLYARPWLSDPDWQTRETHLADTVARRFAGMETGRLIYVGGWQHLLCPTDAGTLCDRLAHLHPRRMLLCFQEREYALLG